ncbi:hypothetical protein PBOI14_00160 [Pseudomonas sp. Boi14]|nr:hypothetical protein PBOI14_00160 [Pseudomonas sp. Boi14]
MLQGQIVALEQALSRTRDTRRFIADGLEYLPVATLISDPDGKILLANRNAREVFAHSLVGEGLIAQLAALGYPGLTEPALYPGWNNCRRWSSVMFSSAACEWNWRRCCRWTAIPPLAGC